MKKQLQNTPVSIIEMKTAELSVLQGRSEHAIDMVTSTINSLSSVNEEIEVKVQEIAVLKDQLQATENGLLNTKNSNKRIIDKFKSLIEA